MKRADGNLLIDSIDECCWPASSVSSRTAIAAQADRFYRFAIDFGIYDSSSGAMGNGDFQPLMKRMALFFLSLSSRTVCMRISTDFIQSV